MISIIPHASAFGGVYWQAVFPDRTVTTLHHDRETVLAYARACARRWWPRAGWLIYPKEAA